MINKGFIPLTILLLGVMTVEGFSKETKTVKKEKKVLESSSEGRIISLSTLMKTPNRINFMYRTDSGTCDSTNESFKDIWKDIPEIPLKIYKTPMASVKYFHTDVLNNKMKIKIGFPNKNLTALIEDESGINYLFFDTLENCKETSVVLNEIVEERENGNVQSPEVEEDENKGVKISFQTILNNPHKVDYIYSVGDKVCKTTIQSLSDIYRNVKNKEIDNNLIKDTKSAISFVYNELFSGDLNIRTGFDNKNLTIMTDNEGVEYFYFDTLESCNETSKLLSETK
jgi:hypothetical protein